jgi:hypothetical protein
VVACATFYKQGFSVPSHRFPRSLLQHYNLELHNLTLSGVLHIMTFVTLCEAYMGIGSHFDLWNHFFRVRLSQGSNTEVAVLEGMVIHVKSVHGIDPYFNVPMTESMNGWQKM